MTVSGSNSDPNDLAGIHATITCAHAVLKSAETLLRSPQLVLVNDTAETIAAQNARIVGVATPWPSAVVAPVV
jgi:hypothetical protein